MLHIRFCIGFFQSVEPRNDYDNDDDHQNLKILGVLVWARKMKTIATRRQNALNYLNGDKYNSRYFWPDEYSEDYIAFMVPFVSVSVVYQSVSKTYVNLVADKLRCCHVFIMHHRFIGADCTDAELFTCCACAIPDT